MRLTYLSLWAREPGRPGHLGSGLSGAGPNVAGAYLGSDARLGTGRAARISGYDTRANVGLGGTIQLCESHGT